MPRPPAATAAVAHRLVRGDRRGSWTVRDADPDRAGHHSPAESLGQDGPHPLSHQLRQCPVTTVVPRRTTGGHGAAAGLEHLEARSDALELGEHRFEASGLVLLVTLVQLQRRAPRLGLTAPEADLDPFGGGAGADRDATVGHEHGDGHLGRSTHADRGPLCAPHRQGAHHGVRAHARRCADRGERSS